MPPFVLVALKVVFLALLYFFIYRAVRSVAADLGASPVSKARGEPAGGRQTTAGRRGGKAPKTIVVTDEQGRKLETRRLDGPVQIGRADACHIRLSDSYVSSFHARIFDRNGSWYVEDLGSTNGTYVNQRRVSTPTEVRAGDRVRIGKTVLELRR